MTMYVVSDPLTFSSDLTSSYLTVGIKFQRRNYLQTTGPPVLSADYILASCIYHPFDVKIALSLTSRKLVLACSGEM